MARARCMLYYSEVYRLDQSTGLGFEGIGWTEQRPTVLCATYDEAQRLEWRP